MRPAVQPVPIRGLAKRSSRAFLAAGWAVAQACGCIERPPGKGRLFESRRCRGKPIGPYSERDRVPKGKIRGCTSAPAATHTPTAAGRSGACDGPLLNRRNFRGLLRFMQWTAVGRQARCTHPASGQLHGRACGRTRYALKPAGRAAGLAGGHRKRAGKKMHCLGAACSACIGSGQETGGAPSRRKELSEKMVCRGRSVPCAASTPPQSCLGWIAREQNKLPIFLWCTQFCVAQRTASVRKPCHRLATPNGRIRTKKTNKPKRQSSGGIRQSMQIL